MSTIKNYIYKLVVKYFLATGVKWARRMRKHLSSGLASEEVVRTPIVLHHCGTRKSLYQVRMWLPVLEQYTGEVTIVVRELHGIDLQEETTIPVVYIPGASGVSSLISSPDVKVVLYTANTGKNIHLVRDVNMKHIFIGHGDSDKLASAHNLFKMYDHSFVAGDAHVDRFKRNGIDLPENYFYKVGRPNVVLKVKPLEIKPFSPKKTILYAPTWEGAHSDSSYSSVLILMEDLLSTFKELDVNVIVRLHPFTGSNDSLFSEKCMELQGKYEHDSWITFDSDSDIYQQMAESSYLVSDVSSVISDYLYFNKPIYITNPREEEDFEVSFPVATCCNVITPSNYNNYFSKEGILDNRSVEREKYRCYVMGDSPENAIDNFSEALYSLVEAQHAMVRDIQQSVV